MTAAAETARLRQGLYRFFGGALIAPEEERLGELAAAAAFLDDMGMEAFTFYPLWRRLTEVMADTTPGPALAAEYVRLFASGADGALCPPNESYYRAKAEGGGIAEVVAGLQREYRRLGLTLAGASTVPDHAATELEIMSALCGREASAWELADQAAIAACLADEDRFLRRHLAGWFPRLWERVRGVASHGFYPTLVEAAHAYVVHDTDLVRALRGRLGVAT